MRYLQTQCEQFLPSRKAEWTVCYNAVIPVHMY